MQVQECALFVTDTTPIETNIQGEDKAAQGQ